MCTHSQNRRRSGRIAAAGAARRQAGWLLASTRGTGTVEYAILLGVIVALTVALGRLASRSAGGYYTTTTHAFSGVVAAASGDSAPGTGGGSGDGGDESDEDSDGGETGDPPALAGPGIELVYQGNWAGFRVRATDTGVIRWGDGTQESLRRGKHSYQHLYADPGARHRVVIAGPIASFRNAADTELRTVASFGTGTGLTDLSDAFYNADNLESVAQIPATVVKLRSTFEDMDASPAGLGAWNTANIRNMDSTFENAGAFNADISAWQTGSVKQMKRMFLNAAAFDQDLSDWCVDSAKKKEPHGFSYGSGLAPQHMPDWGNSC